jgi:hypothetical protein
MVIYYIAPFWYIFSETEHFTVLLGQIFNLIFNYLIHTNLVVYYLLNM